MPNTEPTHTWEALLAAVPAPTPEASALYALTTTPADLIEVGARIRSEKILTDLVRWGGQVAEFLPKATPAQRRLLLGYSDGFFRVTVHEGAKLRSMLASRTGKVDEREAERLAIIGAAAQAYSDGMDERDRLTTALEGLRRYDSSLQDRIDLAHGSVSDAEGLARSLRALSKLWALVSSASGQAGRRADDESAANHAAWRANPSAGGRAPRARTRAGASATGVDTVKMSEKLRQK